MLFFDIVLDSFFSLVYWPFQGFGVGGGVIFTSLKIRDFDIFL